MNINLKNKAELDLAYTVPEGYFDSVLDRVLVKINTASDDASHVDHISADTMKVPSDYFASNLEKWSNKVMADQSPVTEMDLIQQSTFKAPNGYFEKPVFEIPKKQYEATPLYSNLRIVTNIAASFLVLVLIGFAFFKTPVKPTAAASSAMISSEEWAKFIDDEEVLTKESEGKDPLVNLDNVSDNDIKAFLNDEKYLELF